jgi:flavin reductase (DIM6/NTAB) family NADH-FMN oxidoreductase RutF
MDAVWGETLERPASLKQAMRSLVGGVSVVTAGIGADRTGATVTSAHSLAVEPETMVVNINLGSSTWPVIQRYGHFAVSLLADRHRAVADRFAGVGGLKGVERYAGARWTTLATGASVLADALAAIDCEVEHVVQRHSHAIVIGAVRAVRLGSGDALVYANGRYGTYSD